ncbi:MAG: catecholate siderophore receptor Fiu, partial [Sphingomonadaceae bacterium]
QFSTTLAALLLPLASHAATDSGPDSADSAGAIVAEVRVDGSRQNDFKAERAASPKYTEKLVDTAQTLSVIKKELIEQQGALTLTEALRNTPGVGAFFLGENGSTSTGDAIYMRGFDAAGSIFVDGVRDVGTVSRDTFNIEQVDVLKGPAGTDNGRSSPTGSINLVSKQPLASDAYSGSASVGSGQQRRATADLNHVLDSASALRVNLLDQDSGNPARDRVRNRRWAVAPSLAFGLGSPTRVTLNLLHVRQDNIPDGGVLTIGLPGYSSPDPARPFLSSAAPVDPRNFYGSTLDHDHVRADMLTARIEHDFAGGARLVNTTRYGKTSQDYLLTAYTASSANLPKDIVKAGADPLSWVMARTNLNFKDQQNEILTNQSTLSWDAVTGAIRHTLVGGLELSNEKQSNYTWAATTGSALPVVNIYHPNPDAPVKLSYARNGASGDGSTSTLSLYLFDTAKLGERWILNGGVRVDHYNTRYHGITLQTAVAAPAPQPLPVGTPIPVALGASDNLLNGKLSLLYKPSTDSSIYGLIASSKAPPGGNTFTLSSAANSSANPNYDPQSTTTYEIGSKWDLLKQKLSLSAAAYRTEVRNEIEVDPTDTSKYYQNGKKRVQGIELGVTGELLRNWLISAGYTRMATKVEAGKIVTAAGENALSYTPKQAFTLWTAYTLPRGLQLGGGARYAGKLLRGTDGAIGTPAYTNAYWVLDAMLAYPVSKQLDLRLNLYNLADQQYVAAINKSGYRYTPGAPRSASLSANFHF